jgi:hypothetical protein
MRAEFSATYPAGTDFFLMFDSARMVASYMGENIPEDLSIVDLEYLASERCVSMHTILLEYQYYQRGILGWD